MRPIEAGRAPEAIRTIGLTMLMIGFLTVTHTAFRVGALPVSDLFFFAASALAAMSYAMTPSQPMAPLPTLQVLGFLTLACGGTVASITAVDPPESFGVVIRILFLGIVWLWTATALLRSRADVERAVKFWILSGVIGGMAAIAQILGYQVLSNTYVWWGRASGLTEHVSDFGGAMGAVFVPTLAMLVSRRLVSPDALIPAIGFLFVSVGLILSGSLGAMLGAAAGATAWLVLRRGSMRIVLRTLSLLIFALFGVVALASAIGARTPLQRVDAVSGAFGAKYNTVSIRVETNREAWKVISENPITGQGLDKISQKTRTGAEVHNTFLAVWYETGLIGLTGLVVLLVWVGMAAWRGLREPSVEGEVSYGSALAAGALAYGTFGMTHPALYQRYGWVAIALLMAWIRTGESDHVISSSVALKRVR